MTLIIGETAPNFTLQNTKGNIVELYDILQNKEVVLLFFPVAFSSTCTEELCTVRDNMKMYNALDAKVIGISVDSFFTLREFKKAQNLNFTLLSDFNREVSREYGILNNDFYGMKGVAKRSAFVIGKDRSIKHVQVLEDADNMPDLNAIIQTLSNS